MRAASVKRPSSPTIYTRCNKCQRFRYKADYCRSRTIISSFRSGNHSYQDCAARHSNATAICKNCGGPPKFGLLKKCPIFLETSEALKLRASTNIPFKQALDEVKKSHHNEIHHSSQIASNDTTVKSPSLPVVSSNQIAKKTIGVKILTDDLRNVINWLFSSVLYIISTLDSSHSQKVTELVVKLNQSVSQVTHSSGAPPNPLTLYSTPSSSSILTSPQNR